MKTCFRILLLVCLAFIRFEVRPVGFEKIAKLTGPAKTGNLPNPSVHGYNRLAIRCVLNVNTGKELNMMK